MHTSSSSAGSPARTDVEGGACAVGGRAVSLSLSLSRRSFQGLSTILSLGKTRAGGERRGEEADSSSSSSDPAVAAAYLGKLN